MAYPALPWRLRGRALAVPRLVDIHHARPSMPCELAIVPVLPGKWRYRRRAPLLGTGWTAPRRRFVRLLHPRSG